MEFKVKKGVVLPRIDKSGPRNKKYPFATMEIDEMFFVPKGDSNKFSIYASQRGRVLHRKFRTQSVTMRQDLTTNEWELCKDGAAGAQKGVAVCRIA